MVQIGHFLCLPEPSIKKESLVSFPLSSHLPFPTLYSVLLSFLCELCEIIFVPGKTMHMYKHLTDNVKNLSVGKEGLVPCSSNNASFPW